jgi:flagellar export protein FliJ
MSDGFHFSLEAVLRLWQREEQQAQVALATAVRDYAAAADAEDGLKQRGRAASSDAVREAGMAFDAAARISTLYYLDRCAQAARRQHSVVEHWEQEVHSRRTLLVEAARRRRGLEKLRERRHHDFTMDRRRREEQWLDELATTRAARRDGYGSVDDAC